jgi:uncharacterized protein (DUF2237 family)
MLAGVIAGRFWLAFKRVSQLCLKLRATRVNPAPIQMTTSLPAKNVLGTELQACSFDPLTGYFRDGCCHTDANDVGTHVICARVTAEFLAFSMSQGNDLVTPRPEWRFVGLKPGNRWCLCANRWLQALQAGVAPPVVLEATHERALQIVTLEQLKAHAWQRASS